MDCVRNRDLMFMTNTRAQWEFIWKHVSSQIADLIHESQQPCTLKTNSPSRGLCPRALVAAISSRKMDAWCAAHHRHL